MTRNFVLPSRVSTLALAVAMAAGPTPAAAQSLQGTPTVSSGSATVSEGAGTTNVTVDSSQAVIDWTPDDNLVGNFGAIAFQNQGTTATFSGSTDFAVLNRINVADNSRQIFMDGTIQSFVNETVGGSVYFYSPSGFVLGPHSLINVGSLVLSASPIAVDGNGNFINNGTVVFGQASNPSASIVTVSDINGTSVINALNGGSYVAMVAPRVEHHGTINVNGSAALVGAEGATMTFRPSGLFDIQVDVGTTDGEGVNIDGTIAGPASSSTDDFHRIYAVAVPKNTALTMAIAAGASLGFDVAQAADVVGNAVVLSAGHNISFGTAEFDQAAAGGAPANIRISNAAITSALNADASGDIDLNAFSEGLTHLASDATLRSTGGHIWVHSFTDGLLDIDGNVSLTNDRFGDSTGESVTAGQTAIYSQTGGTTNIDGNVTMSANGFGGASFESGVNAGNGTGGQVLIQAEAGTNLSIGGTVTISANGFGGQAGASNVNAGNGQGGNVVAQTIGNDAHLSIGSTVTVDASGVGGSGDGFTNECLSCNGLGGTGTGGTIFIGTSTGAGSSAFYGGLAELHADGLGGRSGATGSSSGTGTGGSVSVFSAGGSAVEGFGTTFANDVHASAVGNGGASSIPGIAAGLGDGGFVQVSATANSTLGILGDLRAEADGNGGFNDFDVNGGNGIGGNININAGGGNALIVVGADTILSADGQGSFSIGDCIGCGGAGGNGTGGTINVFGGSGTNNRLTFTGALSMSSDGFGGIGATGPAGNGTGGNAQVSLASGLAMTVGNGLAMDASGTGGTGYNGSNGGSGQGGTAATYGNGGSLAVTGNAFLTSSGFGGGTDLESSGNGGAGTGGIAQVWAPAGSIDFGNSLFLEARGQGGNAPNGTGGNGKGGTAGFQAPGGAIHVAGNLFVDSGALGGDGLTGGSATANIFVQNSSPNAVDLFVRNGGSLDVDGVAALAAEAVGGNGSNGNGGAAQGGEVDVIGYAGTIDLGTLAIDANAFGGNGGAGGNGGSATGGRVFVDFGGGAAATGATITLGSATITTDGEGGDGGAGTDGATGGNGGAGGNGTGGRIGFTGSAGSGTLISGTAILTSLGRGGAGGAGGSGSVGFGGNGGAGGSGASNGIQTGTVSVDLAPNPGGGATYSFLSADSSAFGGTGGDGGSGAGGTGTGGNGGNAAGGGASFLARGVLVSADTVQLTANATGGDGGAGSPGGNGGNARTGAVAVESKDRFNHPDQRGTLVVNSIVGTAIAQGGAGAVDGVGSVIGGSYFRVLNGDATIGSVSINISGDVYDNTFANSTVSMRDGTATIGDFSFTTTGELALDASNGSMTANSINLAAGNFIVDSFSGTQVGPGTYTAGSFSIFTGGNFVTNAHLVSGGSLGIVAPGAIDMRNATSSDGSLALDAGNSILAGTLDAAGSVDIFAEDNITTGAINSGDFIDVISNTGAISVGNLNAVSTINLDSPGAITFGDVLGEALDFDSGASVTGGNITVGREVKGDAGGTITLGNISAGIQVTGGPADNGYSVGLASPGAIVVGNVEANESIGFATLGNLTTGSINSGGDALALASGNMTLGAITTPNSGRTYLADGSMFLNAGGPDNFDPALVFAATPVRSGGSILINGPVSTGSFQAAAGTTLTTGAITAALGIDLDAGGNISTAALDSGASVEATTGGSVQTGNIDAATSVFGRAFTTFTAGTIDAGTSIDIRSNGLTSLSTLNAGDFIDLRTGGGIQLADATSGETIYILTGGTMTGGNLTAGNTVAAQAANGITLGNLSAGIVNPSSVPEARHAVGLGSNGPISVGTITALGDIGMGTAGTATTGDMNSGGGILALVSGDMQFGSMTTNADGYIYLADNSMAALGGTFDNFNRAPVLAATPVRSSGSIAISGPVSTGRFQAAAGTTLTTGAITAPLGIYIDAGGGIITGALSSDDDVEVNGDGSIQAGAVTSTAGRLLVFAGGSIATGAINTGGLTQLVTDGGNVTTGNISANDSVFVSASGNINAGNLTGTSIGLSAGGDIGFGNVGATAFQFDAGGAVTGGSVAATDGIFGSAGGLLTINALWQAPVVDVRSNDIAIASTGGIDAGASGSITLISTNGTQTQIGDGLSGNGYQLSNAEFGRLSSGSLQIIGRADASASVDMLIGDLSVTGPLAGSTIDDPNGFVDFITADFQNESIGGEIRVVGELRATGFLDTNTIDFTTGRFELDAETGLIQITGNTTNDLSGELFIEADRIHVASGTILDKLAANPTYSGREDELNAPAAVQRPDGVIRAGSIDTDVTQAILVQNTGTKETPAGFLTFGDGPLFSADNGPPGPIELVINGQLITEGGTLTGSDVRDYLIDDNNIGFFTENSTINGCQLTGPCSVVVEPPFPPDFTPTPGIQQEIVLLGDDPAPPPEFGNEDAIDDNEEDEAAETSPITPPEPLFDTTELGEPEATGNPAFNTTMRSQPGLVEEGDVDDPVSGSGNPALMEDDTPTANEEKQP